jgi:hypothetical protein
VDQARLDVVKADRRESIVNVVNDKIAKLKVKRNEIKLKMRTQETKDFESLDGNLTADNYLIQRKVNHSMILFYLNQVLRKYTRQKQNKTKRKQTK